MTRYDADDIGVINRWRLTTGSDSATHYSRDSAGDPHCPRVVARCRQRSPIAPPGAIDTPAQLRSIGCAAFMSTQIHAFGLPWLAQEAHSRLDAGSTA